MSATVFDEFWDCDDNGLGNNVSDWVVGRLSVDFIGSNPRDMVPCSSDETELLIDVVAVCPASVLCSVSLCSAIPVPLFVGSDAAGILVSLSGDVVTRVTRKSQDGSPEMTF